MAQADGISVLAAYLAAPGNAAGRRDAPGQQTPGNDTGQVTGQVTPEVERLVLALDGAMKRAQIQQALDLKHRDHFRNGYLQPALASGMVAMTVPDKPRSSRQQYRLTDAGLVLRAALLRKHRTR